RLASASRRCCRASAGGASAAPPIPRQSSARPAARSSLPRPIRMAPGPPSIPLGRTGHDTTPPSDGEAGVHRTPAFPCNTRGAGLPPLQGRRNGVSGLHWAFKADASPPRASPAGHQGTVNTCLMRCG
ncbi:hypothetical protein HMPREF0731_0790, partial [Pseudoroseomonas cervicalis ATCC 49957]